MNDEERRTIEIMQTAHGNGYNEGYHDGYGEGQEDCYVRMMNLKAEHKENKITKDTSLVIARAEGFRDGYEAGYTDGSFIGYSDGWEKAKMKYMKY